MTAWALRGLNFSIFLEPVLDDLLGSLNLPDVIAVIPSTPFIV